MKRWFVTSALGGALGCSTARSDAERLEGLSRFGDIPGISTNPGAGEYSEAACDAGQYIYLMTVERALLRFDPRSLQTEMLGAIDCPTTAATNSMAVDRLNNAWIGFYGGEIFRLSLDTLRCEPSGYASGQLGWKRFGMAFVSDAADSPSETLYLAEGDPEQPVYAGIGKVDAANLSLSAIGLFVNPIAGGWCEINGRGDGRLFAFCPGDPARLVELDKATGATLAATGLPFDEASSFAFAQWGGDFILFTSVGEGSHIDAFTPGAGTRRIVERIDFDVVGAGVSTCAPTWSPPR